MEIIFAALAGAVQGLSEFLPISSTAHLIIFQKIFDLSQDQFGLAFDASIHLGTLIAVFAFFYKDYINIFKNGLYLKLAVGTIPALVAGLLLEKVIETDFRSLSLIGIALIGFSFVMLAAERLSQNKTNDKPISSLDSFLVGCAQALALIPGISRSGSTISAGLFLGQSRESAARFAFLLSGPVIAGAGFKKFTEVFTSPAGFENIGIAMVGIVSSLIFGYVTIKYFLKYLTTKNLYPFIIYRIILGISLLLIPFVVQA